MAVRHDKEQNLRLCIASNRPDHEKAIAKGNHHVLKNLPGRESSVQQREDTNDVRRPCRRGRRGGGVLFLTDARTMPVDHR